jgi:hypothetical protein
MSDKSNDTNQPEGAQAEGSFTPTLTGATSLEAQAQGPEENQDGSAIASPSPAGSEGIWEHRAWPMDGAQYGIFFAVSMDGDAFLVSARESVLNANDERSFMEKSDWDGLPTEPGFYKGKAEFWFEQGYFEGYPAPGECSFGWQMVECEPLETPKASASEAKPSNPSPSEVSQ